MNRRSLPIAISLAAAIAWTTAGCGAGGSGGESPVELRRHVVVRWGSPLNGYLAWCSISDDGSTAEILVDPSIRRSALEAMLAHELGHATGLGHVPLEDCAMSAHVTAPLMLCPHEVALMRSTGRAISTSVEDPELAAAAAGAIAAWNSAVGAEVMR